MAFITLPFGDVKLAV